MEVVRSETLNFLVVIVVKRNKCEVLVMITTRMSDDDFYFIFCMYLLKRVIKLIISSTFTSTPVNRTYIKFLPPSPYTRSMETMGTFLTP